ncbi:family 20 glycosylhydrolase [Rhodopirellula sp. P2]|uniref:family 20 glycosylhydrolase n=1 Tax=Rhodopirellula sp. P2 TaxID=2127060 RepID=UPI002368F1C7|nr:family 20 glycosylhydrolase [Rhodopirellula sp. P2]WDQ14782.1 family 20 glycosylhydrolase [Rhodopirellula sp. P2]
MTFRCLFVFLLLTSSVAAAEIPMVPLPTKMKIQQGAKLDFPQILTAETPDDPTWATHLAIFGERLKWMTRGEHQLQFADGEHALLTFTHSAELRPEAYSIAVTSNQIQVAASTVKGLAHATATLLQLIGSDNSKSIPQLQIEDSPQLTYRNLMIDMGRNPHSIELLKETIDLLWFYKVDSVQLHLTDDQRIAFPSTAFPKLWDGVISVAEFKDLERYAVERGVTIIPELEVPGHSELLRRVYPEVFGKTATDLTQSETALKGIKTLLDEMMAVFPSSPYVHIGGDEAFGVPENLQRDLINKLQAYLKSKGTETLVWEGPRAGTGDNRVHPEVIHLNWRTINYPADEMVQNGHRVVNAAWDPLYLVDHYPRTNFTMTSPQHIYETLSLTRFKHVNPEIRTYANPIEVEPTDKLIGFCMPWWEGREENFSSQAFPRLIPFAEVAWNPNVERNYDDFKSRSSLAEKARSAAFYPVSIDATNLIVPADGVFEHSTLVTLKMAEIAGRSSSSFEIRYTTDGSEPSLESTRYESPFELTRSATVRATAFSAKQAIGHGSRCNLVKVNGQPNLALHKPVTSSATSGPPFSVQRITDGGTDNLGFYLGYPADPEPIHLTIDLGSVQSVKQINVFAYSIAGSFEKYRVETSTNGVDFEGVTARMEKPADPTVPAEHHFSPREVRYVRLLSHGNKGYVFNSFSKIIEVQVF